MSTRKSNFYSILFYFFILQGIIDISAQELLHELFNNIENSANWNHHLSEAKKIQVSQCLVDILQIFLQFHYFFVEQAIDDRTDIVYQATTSHGGGIVGARDFVILRCHGEKDSSLISAAVSVPFPQIPPRKNFTR